MIFYHFTAIEYLDSILAHGLNRGENPVSATETKHAVWLTTDPAPDGHGLTDGGPVPAAIRRANGLPENARFPDKRRVRITIRWPERRARRWLPWARRRLDPAWLNTLISIGGGTVKAKSWWIVDAIPPEAFTRVDVRENGRWHPLEMAVPA